jgi:hypothetical protein
VNLAGSIYLLCSLTALLCALLLLRAYRRSQYKLLLWGGICFVGLTLSNVLLFIDKLIVPYVDLTTGRLMLTLLSLMVLLYGLVWDAE